MVSTHFSAPPNKRLLAAGMDLLCVFSIATCLAPFLKVAEIAVRFEWMTIGVYFIYEAMFLWWWQGQSPGRRLLGTMVLRLSGQRLSWVQAALRPGARMIALILMSDFVFRYSWPDFQGDIRIPLFPLIEIGLILTMASRRTVADYVAFTVVANTPPLQPHRAPAAPMYSVRDAEFGFPPSRPKPESGSEVKRSNQWLERTAGQRRWPEPFALRASAAAHPQRWAAAEYPRSHLCVAPSIA